jgi:glycosyltransferase involved in cell wall biosynthesis
MYNLEKYVGRCIRSIESQFRDDDVRYEIIVVNDGSTDNSPNVVAELQQQNANIVLINQKNAGYQYARNTGIDAATGKYVYFIDCDDVLLQNVILQQVEHMEHDNLDALRVATISEYQSSIDSALNHPNVEAQYSRVVSGIEYLKETSLVRANCHEVWRYIYRLDILKKNNIRFEKLIAEDMLFNCLYMMYAERVATSNIITYVYVYYSNSVCHKHRPFAEMEKLGFDLLHAFFDYWDKFNDILNSNGLTEAAKAYKDYVVFAYILWPMIREAASLSVCKNVISQLKLENAYPISKPSNIPGTQMKNNRVLNALWHISRYYPLWMTTVAARRILRLRLNRSKKSLR